MSILAAKLLGASRPELGRWTVSPRPFRLGWPPQAKRTDRTMDRWSCRRRDLDDENFVCAVRPQVKQLSEATTETIQLPDDQGAALT